MSNRENGPLIFRDVVQASPSLFPLHQSDDGRLVQLIRLTEQEYATASFLDARLLQGGKNHAVVTWTELQNAAVGLPIACDFLFHISHVGSTLLSRLLGMRPEVLSIREPAILKLLIDSSASSRRKVYLQLWSRTFRADQRSLIKTTSFVNQIALDLMDLDQDAKALLLYVPPQTFLRALLDGVQSDIDSHAVSRRQRLLELGVGEVDPIETMSAGIRVAMSWLCEMLSLAEVAERFPTRTLWIDFDEFLESPLDQLQGIQLFYRISSEPDPVAVATCMQRYSKRPEVSYDSSFRRRLLEESQKKYSVEIERGLAWLSTPRVKEAIRRIGNQLPDCDKRRILSTD